MPFLLASVMLCSLLFTSWLFFLTRPFYKCILEFAINISFVCSCSHGYHIFQFLSYEDESKILFFMPQHTFQSWENYFITSKIYMLKIQHFFFQFFVVSFLIHPLLNQLLLPVWCYHHLLCLPESSLKSMLTWPLSSWVRFSLLQVLLNL